MADAITRPRAEESSPTEGVSLIIDQVRHRGDAALRELTRQFDGVEVVSLVVSHTDALAALERVPVRLRSALEVAWDRILAYHQHERAPAGDFELDGILVRHLQRPVGRVGIYAPGGRARYPSTVLMCAAPARVAGVGELTLVVPPGSNGTVADETLAAAAIAGVDHIYCVGGAQAIAALAFGTETIRPVDVIVGPGNKYVAEAKRQVSGWWASPPDTQVLPRWW